MSHIIESLRKFLSVKHGKVIFFGVFAALFSLLSILIIKTGIVNTETTRNKIIAVEENTPPPKSSPTPKAQQATSNDQEESLLPGGELDEVSAEEFRNKYGNINQPHQPSESKKDCDNRFPDNGFKHVYRDSWERTPSKKTEFQIENKTDKPIWVRLLHPTAEFPIVGYIVHPFEQSVKRIPIGLYAIDFAHGTKWCNIYTGMIESRLLAVSQKTAMTEKSSIHFRVMQDSKGNLDAELIPLPRMKADEDESDLLIEKTRPK